MVLYAYYKQGIGLFTNTAGTTFTSEDTTMTCNEAMLVNNGFTKLLSYKLTVASYEYPINAKFAQQPDNLLLYRYVDTLDPVKNVSADYVSDAAFFSEIQYSPDYLID